MHINVTGVDKRFPKGTIYPGVIALYRALTEARHYRRMHRIQSQRVFSQSLNGHATAAESSSVVSAEDVAQVEQVRNKCCVYRLHRSVKHRQHIYMQKARRWLSPFHVLYHKGKLAHLHACCLSLVIWKAAADYSNILMTVPAS